MSSTLCLFLSLCFFAFFGNSVGNSCTDEFLRDQFPESLKSKSITIATIAQYSPFITYNGYGVPCGFDVDLMNLIGSIYRIEFKYQYVSVDDLIPAVQNNSNTISITNQAITSDRISMVNFVQFFLAGVTFIAKSTYTRNITGLTDLCGQRVSVITATLQETALQLTQSLCGGNNITIISVPTFTQLIEVVENNTADLGFQDEPVLIGAVIQSNGQLKLIGHPFFVTPRGILCNRNNRGLCCGLVNAINYLIKEGLYEQLLKRYSFSYKNNGVCPSRLNLNGTICSHRCEPHSSLCRKYLN